MRTSSQLLAGVALILVSLCPAQAIDTDPGYGPWSKSARSNGKPVLAGPYYKPTKRYFTKNGAVLYDFVPVSPRRASRNTALGQEAWMLSKSQQWNIGRGMSPRIVLSTVPARASRPAPIAEGARP
jgi:hypothetical protein